MASICMQRQLKHIALQRAQPAPSPQKTTRIIVYVAYSVVKQSIYEWLDV